MEFRTYLDCEAMSGQHDPWFVIHCDNVALSIVFADSHWWLTVVEDPWRSVKHGTDAVACKLGRHGKVCLASPLMNCLSYPLERATRATRLNTQFQGFIGGLDKFPSLLVLMRNWNGCICKR